MRKLAALALCAVLPVAHAAGWSQADTQRELAFDALLVVDTLQTHNIIERTHTSYFEYNPLLGQHPSIGNVNGYMLACAGLHALISNALPAQDRYWWQWVSLGVEGTTVARNFSIGLRVPL